MNDLSGSSFFPTETCRVDSVEHVSPSSLGCSRTFNMQLHCQSTPGRIGGTATAGSDVVQSGRPIFDDFFQHLWPYIGNNTANVVFQMVKRLWLIRIDQ
ncbi:hypothetical protein TNCV_528171 [Trichonephila clavipes]|nr:hypothetical protein TNCV_528171 [Trichonephila clavipes]